MTADAVTDPAAVELEVMVTAVIPTPHGYVFRAPGNALSRLRAGLPIGNRASLTSSCRAYLIRHPSAGVMLIDTGLHRDAHRDLRRDFGIPMSLLFRQLRPAAPPFDEQLRERGVDPARVGSVVMTHLHVDHTSGMRLLPNARFICSRPEWAAAQDRGASARGYARHHLPPADRVELVDFAVRGEPFGPFPRTIDLLGDRSIRLIETSGHTPGHLSVLLRLTDGSQVLVVGDAAYTLRSIDEEILPMITWNDAASAASLRQLKAYADQNPETILIPSHDPEAGRALAEGSQARDARAG